MIGAIALFVEPIKRVQRADRELGVGGVNIRAITTSEIKFSVLIDAAYTELAVRTLHSLYGLDK